MEQVRGIIKKYSQAELIYRGFEISVWAQKDENLSAFYGVVRYALEGDATARSGRTLPTGYVPSFPNSRDAADWAASQARARIDQELGDAGV